MWRERSTDEDQRQAHMRLTARKICAFSPLLLLILALQPILFHIIVAEGNYMLFDSGVATVMSKATYVVWRVCCREM